jgi:hypothetical protein
MVTLQQLEIKQAASAFQHQATTDGTVYPQSCPQVEMKAVLRQLPAFYLPTSNSQRALHLAAV